MKAGRIFWGTFFAVLGVLLILNRLGIFVLCSLAWWKFWPVLLILFGAALLTRPQNLRWIPLALAGVALGFAVASAFTFAWIDTAFGVDREATRQSFLVSLGPSTERATLDLIAGGGSVRVGDTTEELLTAETETGLGEYRIETDSTGESQEVRLELTGPHRGLALGRLRNRIEVKMNSKPAWNLTLALGASSVDLDLEAYAIDRLSLDCGASRATVRLGTRSPETRVTINAGASSLRLEVPVSAGCEVRLDAPLSSRKFSGFTRVAKGLYRTDQFDDSLQKIMISIDAGVSSLKIDRY